MTIIADADNSLLRNLREISTRQNISAALADYLETYFADADIASFDDASPEELHGAALQHHRLGLLRPPGEAAIAFYTPDFDRHGWHSPHAVIDIVTDDMPFLVDSITMTIYRHGLSIHKLMHPLLGVERDAAGTLLRCAERGSAGIPTESWIHLEIDRISDAKQIEALRADIVEHLADVRAAVEDHLTMREKVVSVIADLQSWPNPENKEIAEFLNWIAAENFVFLGYTHYHADTAAGELKRAADGGLGLLRRTDHPRFGRCLEGIPGNLAEIARMPSALTLVKADGHSTVHRPIYLDFIGVLYRDAAGNILGEHVFVGLYAMHVYHVSTNDIPVVRSKVAAVRSACGFAPGSYRDKALINVLETYPREELIEIGADDLLRIASGIVMLQEHPRVRVFLRNDNWGRYVSALVYMSRDRLDTSVRRRITALLGETLHAESIDFFLMVGESRLARLHLIARMPAGTRYDYDAVFFEREVARIVRGWHDELQQNLIEHCGEEHGNTLLRRYAMALPLAYQDQVPPTSAVSDLERLEVAEKSARIEVKLNAPYGDDGSHQHIKLFLKGFPRPLSAVLPVFDNMGVTVLFEQPFKLIGSEVHIADFAVRLPRADALDNEATRRAFVELLERLLRDEAENDGFNRLVLLAGLDDPRITILRAYGRYLRQAGLPFSQVYIERCLATQPHIARLLADLFAARLSPKGDEARVEAIGSELSAALAQVSNLDDDRILSGFRTAIEATLRTNAWQTGADGKAKGYLSFKISSKLIPFLPKPVPLYEIFVYSPRMEGIHLRGARVARGGLRWSDRMEDFRTEVLGLVKAQTAKNAVIVPLGSKGGFVCKRLPPVSERDAYQAEGIACYSTLIRGMLDLTDNLVNGQVVPPKDVRRRDVDDTYLVVAADKGTASFSDIANGIAIEYGFWLGDAFASGGSVGYDHKKMGITARGAWEAVKRHFRELGRDIQSEPFTVVGIGDMAGDVFGNGMLLSQQIRLIAAFDHSHIFLDPSPDAAKSFVERQRMFALPRSSWEDFDKSLISAGGGVWSRSMKRIPLSPPVRQWLGVTVAEMAPNELINAILKAPIDLLYNGGIGTYVKASSQSHQDANDRGNDVLRVDATELHAKVIGEGGNLGLTQKGRIEFALAGGRLYTDAIDNSAGVDCSDHEVNIKILLSGLVASGDMTTKQRDLLLASMTDDVGHLVLTDNYQQTGAISLEAAAGSELLNAHAQLIRSLEATGTLNRSIEFLPDDKALAERAQMRLGLTPPEISVLLAYAKITLKETILASSLPDAPELQQLLVDYFPTALVRQCGEQLVAHPLRREIITTQLVNRLVNRMGTSFVMQTVDETGADTTRVAAAWYAASELLAAEASWRELEALDLKAPVPQQLALMAALREMVAAATCQILAAQTAGETIASSVDRYRAAVSNAIASAGQGQSGSAALAAQLEARSAIVGVFELVDLARSTQWPLNEVAAACTRLDANLDLNWLGTAVARLPAGNRWQARARAQLASELRTLRQKLLQRSPGEPQDALGAARNVVDELKRNAPQDLAMLSAGLAEIRRLLEV
ncbi:NAD-glutamate dehydrogenase [Propionivibrio sp.]|uniref:NAD-glutamate dehydrogenase n=1 Tax=Propionivibrio sp. TaxID=2212460 RepID=UPI00261FDD01|nr:NAD-glutamate dehydrogenase [Propionivibrio sp.]